MSSLLIPIGKSLLSKGVSIAWENRNQLILYGKTKFGRFKNENIRFSISGLYRIQIPHTNKYLLVFNRRIENQLQPVGGAYKRYEGNSLFDKWGYKQDNASNGLDVDHESSGDLRFMVKGKFAVEVFNWFETGSQRELDPRREFREELLTTGILDKNTFSHFDHKHVRRYSTDIKWSDYFQCHEILIYDVFELLPNEPQKVALIELAKEKYDLEKGYAIATCDEIEKLRIVENGRQIARIGEHTQLLINKNLNK